MSLSRTVLAAATAVSGVLVLSAAPALGDPPRVGPAAATGEFCLDVLPLQAGPVPIYPGGRYCVVTP